MSAIWTTPRTWVAGEVETAAIFNPHVRDNLDYLKGVIDGVVSLQNVLIAGAGSNGALVSGSAAANGMLDVRSGLTHLAFTIDPNTPFPASLQHKHRSLDSTFYPIQLNPLGGAVSCGADFTAGGDLDAAGGFRQNGLQGYTTASVPGTGTSGLLCPGVAAIVNYRHPRAGSVTGLTFLVTTGRTGGTLQLQVWKNGVAISGAVATIDATNPSRISVTFAKDTYTFTATDDLTLNIVGTGFTPTANQAMAWVQLEG